MDISEARRLAHELRLAAYAVPMMFFLSCLNNLAIVYVAPKACVLEYIVELMS